MKKLLLTTSFLTLLISSLFAAETRTELITEEVCPAIAGCWVDVKTGECPDCITITKTITKTFVVEEPTYNTKIPKIESKISQVESKISPVISIDESGRITARCQSGCPSARAATMGYMFEGKYWKKKKSVFERNKDAIDNMPKFPNMRIVSR